MYISLRLSIYTFILLSNERFGEPIQLHRLTSAFPMHIRKVWMLRIFNLILKARSIQCMSDWAFKGGLCENVISINILFAYCKGGNFNIHTRPGLAISSAKQG